MRNVRLNLFAPEHLDRFEPGRFDRIVLEEPYTGVLRTHWAGRAVSVEHDGRILGFAGAMIIDRRAYPWMALSDEMRRDFPILLTKLARRAIAHLFETDRVHEIVATAHAGFDASCRWLEYLGFHQIGFHDQTVRYSKMTAVPMVIPIIAAAASTALSAASQAQKTRTENKFARYEAEVASQQATYQRRLAEANSTHMRSDTNRLLGRQMGALGARGFDPSSDSALLAQQSLATEAELEALEIRNGGFLRAQALDRSAGLTLSRRRAAADREYAGLGIGLLNSATAGMRQ